LVRTKLPCTPTDNEFERRPEAIDALKLLKAFVDLAPCDGFLRIGKIGDHGAVSAEGGGGKVSLNHRGTGDAITGHSRRDRKARPVRRRADLLPLLRSSDPNNSAKRSKSGLRLLDFLDRPVDRLQSVEGTLLDPRFVTGVQGHVVVLGGPVDVTQQPPRLGADDP
jgi:hypothetical protein